jgi:hypothetical protein
LGYRLCANAVLGLSTGKSTLVIPKANDCIAMILGSSEVYGQILDGNPGTYFHPRGWVDNRSNQLDEFEVSSKNTTGNALYIDLMRQQCFNRHFAQGIMLPTGEIIRSGQNT